MREHHSQDQLRIPGAGGELIQSVMRKQADNILKQKDYLEEKHGKSTTAGV
jgi:hypothetical protein